ncbi:hypothetical protein CNY89_12060 [Amaricoccus sp. HAR-UPW-R2A-40]|nr:hypothetical protein CNY89_12060 [Amaricoccus sp. HAR-UPW-R2A-40]
MGDHLHVVTGGPGSGKSSLIAALARRGIGVMPEAGRAIIRDQASIGGRALPWRDLALFAELMLAWELRSHGEAARLDRPVAMDRGVPDVLGYLTLCGLRSHGEAARLDRPVAMDRGVPDVLGYLTLCGLPVPAHVEAAARLFRYNRRVFLAPGGRRSTCRTASAGRTGGKPRRRAGSWRRPMRASDTRSSPCRWPGSRRAPISS